MCIRTRSLSQIYSYWDLVLIKIYTKHQDKGSFILSLSQIYFYWDLVLVQIYAKHQDNVLSILSLCHMYSYWDLVLITIYSYFIIKNYSKYVEIHMFRFSAHSVSIVNWRLKVPFVFCGNQPKYFSRY